MSTVFEGSCTPRDISSNPRSAVAMLTDEHEQELPDKHFGSGATAHGYVACRKR